MAETQDSTYLARTVGTGQVVFQRKGPCPECGCEVTITESSDSSNLTRVTFEATIHHDGIIEPKCATLIALLREEMKSVLALRIRHLGETFQYLRAYSNERTDNG